MEQTDESLNEVKRNELNAPYGSRYWLVTVDSHPMPWEINQYPFQVVYGDEQFVESFCDSLNAEKGEALYEYSEIENQEILSENAQDMP